MNKESLGLRKRDHKCKFCKKGFSSERTLANHMCKNKKRFAEKDTTNSRLGFRVFQRFFAMTTHSKKPKTFEAFIDSSYYIGFVKFGRHLTHIDPLNTELFVDFIIKNGVKLKDWDKEYVYDLFVCDYIQREPVEKALERSVLFMDNWTKSKDVPLHDFFRQITTIEATNVFKMGRISPWVIYLADSATELLNEFNDEQFGIIESKIDPKIWQKKMITNKEDVSFAKEILGATGL
jgi:hypothetical protein